MAARAGSAARLPCRDFVLAGRNRSEPGLDRDRDRQSRSRMGLSSVSPGPDGSPRAAFPRDPATPPDRIVAHSDIAPDRKADPGELFDWALLAAAGIGIWPPPAARGGRGRGIGAVERAAALADLAAIGYCVDPHDPAVALTAFQRRFRPERWDGRLDGETAVRLAEVRAAYDAARQRRRTLR